MPSCSSKQNIILYHHAWDCQDAVAVGMHCTLTVTESSFAENKIPLANHRGVLGPAGFYQ